MILAIDDCRDFVNVDAIARNSIAAKRLLELRLWSQLYIDHDLGEDASGYSIIRWAGGRDLIPNRVLIVSSNPVGRDNIAAALKDFGFKPFKGSSVEFVKDE